MITIKHINVFTAFKVGVVWSALMWIVVALIFLVLQALIGNNTSSTYYYERSRSIDLDDILFVYLCGIPVYAILGGIGYAFSAWMYNVVAGWIGGIEIDVELSGFLLADWFQRGQEYAERSKQYHDRL
jgi:nitrate reductase NapE component